MHDAPNPSQIVTAVRAYLQQEALPALEGGATDDSVRFHGRVAGNLLDIAQRQLAEPPEVAQAERARLQALLGSPTEADLATLTRTLCERLASGALDAATPGLVDHLWVTTLAKLAVDQPKYARYRRILESIDQDRTP